MQQPFAPHQDRVVAEHAELNVKIERLVGFIKGEIFDGLDVAERALLLSQLQFMRGYAFALQSRIAHWRGEL